jgi:hypothetical protein
MNPDLMLSQARGLALDARLDGLATSSATRGTDIDMLQAECSLSGDLCVFYGRLSSFATCTAFETSIGSVENTTLTSLVFHRLISWVGSLTIANNPMMTSISFPSIVSSRFR